MYRQNALPLSPVKRLNLVAAYLQWLEKPNRSWRAEILKCAAAAGTAVGMLVLLAFAAGLLTLL